MHKHLGKTVILSVALSCLLCAPASAKFMKTINVSPASGIGGPVIEVHSDGERWTRIMQTSHVINVDVNIEAGSGWRITAAFIGVPNADFAGSSADGQNPDAIRELGGSKKTKKIARNEPHTFHTDDLVLDRQAIINACNSGNHPATQEHTVFSDISVGIKAFFQTRRDAKKIQEAGKEAGRSETAYTRAPVTIRCLAGPSKIEAPPKPVSVDIRVKRKGQTCPGDTEVTAYIDYDKPMTARFKVIHNGTEPKSAPIEIKARKVTFAGKSWYRVERLERYKLDPGKHTFQIKVIGRGGMSPMKTITVDCPPFKPTSMWLTLKKEDKDVCPKNVDADVRVNGNGPGSVLTKIKNQAGVVMAIESIKVKRDGDKYVGRLTKRFNMSAIDTMLIAEDANDPAHNTGWQSLKIACLESLSGTLDLRGFKASRCEGEAAFSIRTNQPGNVPYQLACTGGRTWGGTVEAHKTGPNTYIGVKVVRFDVSNNELVRCALRNGKPLPYKLLAGAKRTYECHRTTGISNSDNLAPETKPNSQEPREQEKVITTDPQISCKDGAIKKGECICARTHKRVETDKNAYRCVKAVVDSAPDTGKSARDAAIERRRLEAAKKQQAAKERAAAAKRKKAAEKAAAAKRKREAAKKAAERKRKRQAAKKAAETKRKRDAAKKAAKRKRKRKAANNANGAKRLR